MAYIIDECVLLCDECDEFEERATDVGCVGESDTIHHCEAGEDCIGAIVLLDDGAPLNGAETRAVGAIVTDALTPDGYAWLREVLDEEPRTPYQEALHEVWRDTFPDVDDHH